MKRDPKLGVLVHTCFDRKTEIRTHKHLTPGRFYYTTDDKFEFFKAIPLKCECKRYLNDFDAWCLTIKGDALPVYKQPEGKLLHGENDIDEVQIIMVVNRAQTPRVDMVSKADMERAFDKLNEPFNMEYLGNSYYQMINAVHDMILSARMKLIVPFKEDPLDGRLLFPFGPDQRT